MDTVTYPSPEVQQYIGSRFVAYEANMARREDWPLYRSNHIIWTPSVGFADRNGQMHYHSPGFLPPSEFVSVMRIGRARCLMAWTRSSEAAQELEAASAVENAVTPEALWWLGVAYFLERRDNTRMYEVWKQLAVRYPDSPWTKRTYPRSQY